VADATVESWHSDDPMTSDYGMENDIPADSKYEAGRVHDASSFFMDIDNDSIHVSSGVESLDVEHDNIAISKEQLPIGNISQAAPSNESYMVPPRILNQSPNTKKISSSQDPHGTNAEAGLLTKPPKGPHRVFDLFGDTKQRAAEVMKKAKRKLKSDDEASDCDETKAKSHEKRPRRTLQFKLNSDTNIGISKSATASRLLNQKVQDGTFEKHHLRWPRFVKAIQELDKDATFNIDDDPRRVRHLMCLRPQKMSEIYNIGVFKKHVTSCTGPTKAVLRNMPPAGTPTLLTMAAKHKWDKAEAAPNAHLEDFPCPGLNPNNVPPSLW
jgi:hypothetical protein